MNTEQELAKVACGEIRFGGDDGYELTRNAASNAQAVGYDGDGYRPMDGNRFRMFRGPGNECPKCGAVVGIPCVCVWCDDCTRYVGRRCCHGVCSVPSPWDSSCGRVQRLKWEGSRDTTPEGFMWGSGGGNRLRRVEATPLAADLLHMFSKAVPLLVSLQSVRKSMAKSLDLSNLCEDTISYAINEMSRVSKVSSPPLAEREYIAATDDLMANEIWAIMWDLLERRWELEASGVQIYCLDYLREGLYLAVK